MEWIDEDTYKRKLNVIIWAVFGSLNGKCDVSPHTTPHRPLASPSSLPCITLWHRSLVMFWLCLLQVAMYCFAYFGAASPKVCGDANHHTLGTFKCTSYPPLDFTLSKAVHCSNGTGCALLLIGDFAR